jgi:hypothetical protein
LQKIVSVETVSEVPEQKLACATSQISWISDGDETPNATVGVPGRHLNVLVVHEVLSVKSFLDSLAQTALLDPIALLVPRFGSIKTVDAGSGKKLLLLNLEAEEPSMTGCLTRRIATGMAFPAGRLDHQIFRLK